MKIAFTLTMIALMVALGNDRARAQDRPFELGGHTSLLRTASTNTETVINCIPALCPTPPVVKQDRMTEPGVGGRVGYNASRHVALEAESNVLPGNRIVGGGRKVQGFFGVKAGRRWQNVGFFAKARPGFMRLGKGDLRVPPHTACIAVFPTPLGCYEAIPRTFFATDVGAVFEIYASKRAFIRVDGGDIIVRSDERNVAAPTSQADDLPAVVHIPAATRHSFQAAIGAGFRF